MFTATAAETNGRVHPEVEFEAIPTLPTETDTTRKELMKKLGITSVNTLKGYCQLWGIDPAKDPYTPDEVACLTHAYEHVHPKTKNWSKERYLEYIHQLTAQPQPGEEHGRHTPKKGGESAAPFVPDAEHERDEFTEDALEVGAIVRANYGAALDNMGAAIAEGMKQELDLAVMRNFAKLLKAEAQPGKNATQSYFDKVMKAALNTPGRQLKLIKPNQGDSHSRQMEG